MHKVGIIGCGGMGRGHSGNLAAIPGVEIAATTDKSPVAAEALAKVYGAKAYADTGALLDSAPVDIVVICTPTNAHAEAAIAAAQHGKHILTEKPLARTLEQADQVIAAVEKAGVRMLVGHVLRFFPEYVTAKHLLDGGQVGRPGVCRTTRASHHPRGSDDWFADYEKSGGVVLDMLIHDFDLVRWYFGEVECVYCRGLAYAGLDHTDYALITLRHASRVITHVEASWALPAGNFMTKLEIAGDGGLLDFDNESSVPLKVLRKQTGDALAPGVMVPESPVAKNPYALEDEHFISCLDSGAPFAVSPQDGRAALAIGLAALESARTGQPVRPG